MTFRWEAHFAGTVTRWCRQRTSNGTIKARRNVKRTDLSDLHKYTKMWHKGGVERDAVESILMLVEEERRYDHDHDHDHFQV